MGAKLHNLRVAVWGEPPETAEERKVGSRMHLMNEKIVTDNLAAFAED